VQAHHVVVQVANALIALVAVLAGEWLLPGVHEQVGVQVTPREERLGAPVTLEGPLHVGVVRAHVGAQVRLGGPVLRAALALKDSRLGLAGVGAQVGQQLGAQDEPPFAVLACEGSLRRVHRLHVVSQAVPRGEALAALLALVPHLAHSVHGDHVQLQLEVSGKLLLALAARVQGPRGTSRLLLVLAWLRSPSFGLSRGLRFWFFW